MATTSYIVDTPAASFRLSLLRHLCDGLGSREGIYLGENGGPFGMKLLMQLLKWCKLIYNGLDLDEKSSDGLT